MKSSRRIATTICVKAADLYSLYVKWCDHLHNSNPVRKNAKIDFVYCEKLSDDPGVQECDATGKNDTSKAG